MQVELLSRWHHPPEAAFSVERTCFLFPQKPLDLVIKQSNASILYTVILCYICFERNLELEYMYAYKTSDFTRVYMYFTLVDACGVLYDDMQLFNQIESRIVRTIIKMPYGLLINVVYIWKQLIMSLLFTRYNTPRKVKQWDLTKWREQW